ncbi:MAG: sulfurtransferase [Chromatiaceae bacterium]|nr:MAG: sulfurtransferase [Chromatiaceae bacterium]
MSLPQMSLPRTLLLACLILVPAPGLALSTASAAPELATIGATWSKLMTPEELAALIEREPGLRILHIDGNFERGHVPGAVDAPLEALRGPETNPGALPDPAEVVAAVQAWGITADTPLVIVHQGSDPGNFGRAARAYWSFQAMGVERIAILNGGLQGWIAAGLPITTAVSAVTPSQFVPRPLEAARVSTEELKNLLGHDDLARPVDARPLDFFAGRARVPIAARPGTVAGAVNLPFETWFEDNRMVGPERARTIAEAAGLTDGPPVVSFCNTGILAATNWFALSELAGVEGTRLYTSSVVEWSQADGPMDHVPGRLTYYWRMFASWFAGLFT